MRDWSEIQQRIAVRYAPAPSPALAFTGIPLAYWQEEVRLGCVASLTRLEKICAERGADYDKTIVGLR